MGGVPGQHQNITEQEKAAASAAVAALLTAVNRPHYTLPYHLPLFPAVVFLGGR